MGPEDTLTYDLPDGPPRVLGGDRGGGTLMAAEPTPDSAAPVTSPTRTPAALGPRASVLEAHQEAS
jgi:hypothetical protein